MAPLEHGSPLSLDVLHLLQELCRNIHNLIANVIREALAQGIKQTAATHTPSKWAVYHEMDRPDVWELHSLDEEFVSPVIAN